MSAKPDQPTPAGGSSMTALTTHTLPAELGGAEVTLIAGCTAGCADTVAVEVPGRGRLDVPMSWLTPLPVPAPAEPEPGAYLIGEHLTVRLAAYVGENRWRYDCPSDPEGWDAGSWGDLWRDIGGPGVTIRRLTPPPEPGVVPWSWNGITVSFAADEPDGNTLPIRVRVDDKYSFASPDRAREMAGALLAAADSVEAGR